MAQLTRTFGDLTKNDVGEVGGKNASLGEMIRALRADDIRVPDGFATTAHAYRRFLEENELEPVIEEQMRGIAGGTIALDKAGKAVRKAFNRGRFPDDVADAIREAYAELSTRYDTDELNVAVRSSATAEDLPEASFAGQQETFLNVSGEDDLLDACRKCYASLFTDRAIAYRDEKEFDHLDVALSVGVQKMVRSDLAGAGVMFSIDTETGFPNVVVINASWGLGENVVQGTVTPDEYVVFKSFLREEGLSPIIGKTLGSKERKLVYARGGSATTRQVDTKKREQRSFVLSDAETLRLARWACRIEDHYERPMDIEWAKDGEDNELFIVQARPETIMSQKGTSMLQSYRLKEKGERLATGLSIGQAIASGKACILENASQIDEFEPGAILVTEMTDPDWVPIMKQASGIVTDQGGRTSHAAIVSRELGVPAVIGTGDATEALRRGQSITISCAEGDEGYVYEGELEYEQSEVDLESVPETRTRVMMNIASPAAAFRWWRLPCNGIGLARMEFIINGIIKIHPMALLGYDELDDKEAREQIRELTQAYDDRAEYFVDRLSQGIAKIAASQHPDPVIVRLSDFKTNEYANLIGGSAFEPQEENPMLGFRGASRYYSDRYREGFALECRAIERVRETIGFTNVIVMVPFCRTPEEADRVLTEMAGHGLARGRNGLQIYVMCEIPSNVILADEFAERFDGFSIGSNDLTQLVLGVDRDSAELAHLFDATHEAVKRMIELLVSTAHRTGRKVGICGQAPSDHPEFAEFLVRTGIDSISLNPDSVVEVKRHIADAEQERSTARLPSRGRPRRP